MMAMLNSTLTKEKIESQGEKIVRVVCVSWISLCFVDANTDGVTNGKEGCYVRATVALKKH